MPLGPMRTKSQKREGVRQVMHEFKSGELHSGSKSGPVVTNPKQAIAIALSQTGQSRRRAEGGDVGDEPLRDYGREKLKREMTRPLVMPPGIPRSISPLSEAGREVRVLARGGDVEGLVDLPAPETDAADAALVRVSPEVPSALTQAIDSYVGSVGRLRRREFPRRQGGGDTPAATDAAEAAAPAADAVPAAPPLTPTELVGQFFDKFPLGQPTTEDISTADQNLVEAGVGQLDTLPAGSIRGVEGFTTPKGGYVPDPRFYQGQSMHSIASTDLPPEITGQSGTTYDLFQGRSLTPVGPGGPDPNQPNLLIGYRSVPPGGVPTTPPAMPDLPAGSIPSPGGWVTPGGGWIAAPTQPQYGPFVIPGQISTVPGGSFNPIQAPYWDILSGLWRKGFHKHGGAVNPSKSKSDARYQYSPKGTQQCSKCLMFRSPGSCTLVRGTILPRGWCRYFKRK